MNSEKFSKKEDDLMLLKPWEFDQGAEGWRKMADQGKNIEAAETILRYIEVNREAILFPEDDEISPGLTLLYFHAGQLFAASGVESYNRALECFKEAYEGDELWDSYVSATIGYLEKDRNKIKEAIKKIESSLEEDKRVGNLGLVKNFLQALEDGNFNYDEIYQKPRET